jgi:hypothetical protein
LGVGTSGRGRIKERMKKYYALMHENGKMTPVETIPRKGVIKENDGGVKFNDYIL